MTTGLFLDVFNQFAPLGEKYEKLGSNTGNILFMSGLRSMLDCELVRDFEKEKLAEYTAFVTTELIWLRESTEPSQTLLHRIDATRGRPLVPISIGLQAETFKPDFRLQPKMVQALKELESRTILAVRGAYTAEILNKHGIRNIEIVGCPSVYQIPLFQDGLGFLSRNVQVTRPVGNFRSFYGKLSERDALYIRFLATHCAGFIEQTLMPLSATNLKDDIELVRWFDFNSHLFFDLESWVRHNKRYDFSFGLRFHGNVAAILAGMKALFVTIDSRTREMAALFELPQQSLVDADLSVPVQELYAMADYSSFIRNYQPAMNRFEAFLQKAGLSFGKRFQERLAAFQYGSPGPA